MIVRVEDVARPLRHSRAHGARIVEEPTDYPFGERQYTAEDPAGHQWTFSQTLADVAPEEWGGVSVTTPNTQAGQSPARTPRSRTSRGPNPKAAQRATEPPAQSRTPHTPTGSAAPAVVRRRARTPA